MLENLPVLLLKKFVLLPYQENRIDISNDISKKIIDESSLNYDNKLVSICPFDCYEENTNVDDLPLIGVLAKVKAKIVLPNGDYRVTLCGINRVIIKNYFDEEDNLCAAVKRLYIADDHDDYALTKSLKSIALKYMDENPEISNSVANSVNTVNDLDMLTDLITNFMPFELAKKVKYMNEFDYVKRAQNLIKDINVELEVVSIEEKIDEEIHNTLEKEQRDFLIREKINRLNKELGINVSKDMEVNKYNEIIHNLTINEKTRNKLLDEVRKYAYTNESNPDSSVIRNYLDTVINLPWNNESNDEMDLKKIKKSLDNSHFGLEEVKQRILEFIAVKKSNKEIASPIICLIGPPGTGKTTIGMSIAKALNREFYKISVGGLNDPTELTGHKRTYLGSSPGKIMTGVKKCGTNNPVILIDEVDKMVADYKGDPSAVLLDILDPSQNKEFVDSYIEEPFDLSKVLFILTANDIKSISSVLRDRLEIIEINSYTEFEKIDIAKKYLIPKIVSDYHTNKVKITDELLLSIITSYTKEAGVRELDRIIKKIYRSIMVSDKVIKTIDQKLVNDALGPVKYKSKKFENTLPGCVSALGVTPYGGVILSVESLLIPGNGNLIVTGNVEESITELASIAYHYILSMAKEFDIDLKRIEKNDIHINLLNYSVRKTGTSGTLAITTAIISLLKEISVDNETCFTGEVTLHGDVGKVGGIKEKIIGAYNNGYKTIFIPLDNVNDLDKVPIDIKKNIEIKCVSNYLEVFDYLFKKHK